MAGQLVDFLFGAAEGGTQIAQVRFRGLGHIAGEFLVGLAALARLVVKMVRKPNPAIFLVKME